MASMSDAFENRLIDFVLRGQALGVGATAGAGSGFANVYVALFTQSPTDASGVEIGGGLGYARAAVPSTLASWCGTQGAGTTAVSSGTSGTTSNNANIVFPAPTAAWGTVVGFGIFDSQSSGAMLIHGALTTPRTVNNGDAAPVFPPAALVLQFG